MFLGFGFNLALAERRQTYEARAKGQTKSQGPNRTRSCRSADALMRSADLQSAVSPICNRQAAVNQMPPDCSAPSGLQTRDTADYKSALRRRARSFHPAWGCGASRVRFIRVHLWFCFCLVPAYSSNIDLARSVRHWPHLHLIFFGASRHTSHLRGQAPFRIVCPSLSL